MVSPAASAQRADDCSVFAAWGHLEQLHLLAALPHVAQLSGAAESRDCTERQLHELPACGRIPEPQNAIPGRGCQEITVRMEAQRRHPLHMTLQSRQLALRGHVPDLNAR